MSLAFDKIGYVGVHGGVSFERVLMPTSHLSRWGGRPNRGDNTASKVAASLAAALFDPP